MAARVDQAAIIMLAVEFDERTAHLAQQGNAHRLVIDEGLGAAVGAQLAADDQRFARFQFHPGIAEQVRQGIRQAGKVETGGNAGLVLATAHQAAIRPAAEDKPQGIEQDGLARPRLARQHAKPGPEVQVQRFYEHDVADGETGQHVRALF